MHQSERPSTMLVILFWPLAGSHCTDSIASRAACLKPSTDTNHCTRHTSPYVDVLYASILCLSLAPAALSHPLSLH